MSPTSDCESNKANAKEPRNERFEDDQPFDDDPSLSLLGATGAFRFLQPTSALYSWSGWKQSHRHPSSSERSCGHASSEEGSQRSDDEGEFEGHFPARRKDKVLGFIWRSRDNRKGRHALLLRLGEHRQKQPHGTLEPTNSLSATLRGLCALFTRFPYWDISWCVAVVYTLGSIVWVANGFTAVLPLTGNYSSDELKLVTTWTGFAGACIFFLGSYLLFLEAINSNRSGCFGWAVERTVKGIRTDAEVHPGDCGHHYHQQHKHPHVDEADNSRGTQNEDVHKQRQQSADVEVDNGTQDWTEEDGHEHPSGWHSDSEDQALREDDEAAPSPSWLWWPSWRDVRTTFLHQIGFLACAIQLMSGFLFFSSKFTTLPGITDRLPQSAIDGANWAPQIIGCIGFITASWLFMLETQPKWHTPAPNVLGWHVGFWKLIGCVGFLLSAVFGPLGQHGMQFAERQSSIASFWGSWTILFGSLVQWYESLEKYPIVQEGTSRYSEWNEGFVRGSKERRGRVGD